MQGREGNQKKTENWGYVFYGWSLTYLPFSKTIFLKADTFLEKLPTEKIKKKILLIPICRNS